MKLLIQMPFFVPPCFILATFDSFAKFICCGVYTIIFAVEFPLQKNTAIFAITELGLCLREGALSIDETFWLNISSISTLQY